MRKGMGGGRVAQERLRKSPSAIAGRSLGVGSKPPIQIMREWLQGSDGRVWKKRGAGKLVTQKKLLQ